jgi:hypothetical protein
MLGHHRTDFEIRKPPCSRAASSRPSFRSKRETSVRGSSKPRAPASQSSCSGRRWRTGHEYPLWANTHSRSTDIPRCSPAEVNSTCDSDQNWANRWNLFSDSVRSEPNRCNSVLRSVLFSASCFNLGLPATGEPRDGQTPAEVLLISNAGGSVGRGRIAARIASRWSHSLARLSWLLYRGTTRVGGCSDPECSAC